MRDFLTHHNHLVRLLLGLESGFLSCSWMEKIPAVYIAALKMLEIGRDISAANSFKIFCGMSPGTDVFVSFDSLIILYI